MSHFQKQEISVYYVRIVVNVLRPLRNNVLGFLEELAYFSDRPLEVVSNHEGSAASTSQGVSHFKILHHRSHNPSFHSCLPVCGI